MPLRRSSNSGDGNSISSSPSSLRLSAKRRFPLLGRRKTKDAELPPPLPTASPSKSSPHLAKSGLRIHVVLKFEGRAASEHVREYEASPQLKASDRLCQVLLSRLQHCSAELITRHDCNALDPLRKPHRDVKPLRYRITYRVERDGLTLVEKSLRSFQEYELSYEDTREVVAATDRIVGLFLVRHDPAFRWTDPSDAEDSNSESETVRPCTGRPQQIVCVPRSRFINETQKFELAPGYSIELFLRSRCATRYPENRNASIRIDSRQPSPLTLLLGEELTTRVSNLIIDPVDSYKRKFDKRHRTCAGLEGTGGCTHLEDGAVDIMVKVRNSLGPDYNYFSHRIQTSKVLFNDPQGRDFDEFANQVKAKLEKARDMTDKSMRSLDDLTLRVRELRGHGWSVHEPLVVRLDPTVTYCRQTIEALMERLQSGISDVLEHHEDALAIMTVHKRGQLIYDGFLDGAGGSDSTPPEKFATPDLERKALEARLKERIRADITMVCKDTCALDSTDTLPNLRIKVSSASASSIGGSSLPPPSVGASSSVAPSPARSVSASTTLHRAASEVSVTESTNSSRSGHGLSKRAGQQNLKEPDQAPSSPSPETPGPDLRRVPSGVEKAKKHGYMADFMADDENQSEPPYTPSLVDTDSISPRDSIVATPQSARVLSQDQSNEGLRIVDDGRRIIYQEQSDIDAIASGVTELHPHYDAHDEPLELVKDQPGNVPDRKAARRSLDTRMPNLSSTSPSAPADSASEVATPQASKSDRPVTPIQGHAVTSKELPADHADASTSQSSNTQDEAAAKSDTPEAAVVPPQPTPLKSETDTAKQQDTETKDGQWELVDINEAPQAQSVDVDTLQVPTQDANTSAESASNIRDPTIDYSNTEAEEKTEESNVVEKFSNNKDQAVTGDSVTESAECPVKDTETLRESRDSGISVQEPAKDEATSVKESTSQVLETNKEAIAEESEFKSEPVREEVCLTLTAKPSTEDTATAEEAAPAPILEQACSLLETVPEDTAPEPAVVVAKDTHITSTEETTAKKDNSPSENSYFPATASAPLELRKDDFFSLRSSPDKEKTYGGLGYESMTLPRPSTRPRTNTLPERRYSTALTLDLTRGPFDPEDDGSPTAEPPKSASGVYRRHPLHRRQPSAGFVGLQEQRLNKIGLRNALMPYRWQTLREDGVWEGRPSTSHSER